MKSDKMNLTSAVILVILTVLKHGMHVRGEASYVGYRYMNINDESLTQIPDDIPPDASVISLEGSSLHTLPSGVFSNKSKCAFLELSSCKISQIQSGAFVGLDNLELLNLNNNLITNLTAGVFNGLENLITLKLTLNKISVLQADSFQGLQSLVSLDLSSNQMEDIQENSFRGLEELRKLHLHFNNFSSIRSDMWIGLVSIEKLTLDNNTITQIGDNIGKFIPNLKELFLSGNAVSFLTGEEFSDFTALQHLDLSSNKLMTVSINNWIGLKALTDLRLHHNSIRRIHYHAFYSLPSLQILLLHSNQLTSFPEASVNRHRDGLNSVDLLLSLAGNPFHCDGHACWLRRAEEEGWIKWYQDVDLGAMEPECVGYDTYVQKNPMTVYYSNEMYKDRTGKTDLPSWYDRTFWSCDQTGRATRTEQVTKQMQEYSPPKQIAVPIKQRYRETPETTETTETTKATASEISKSDVPYKFYVTYTVVPLVVVLLVVLCVVGLIYRFSGYRCKKQETCLIENVAYRGEIPVNRQPGGCLGLLNRFRYRLLGGVQPRVETEEEVMESIYEEIHIEED